MIIVTIYLLDVLLPHDQRQVTVFGFDVALVVAKAVDPAGLRHILVGEIDKLAALFQQLVPVEAGFALGIQVGEYTSVFAQYIIDVAHKVVEVAVAAVVVHTAAVGGAVLFVCPAVKAFSTFDACLFHIWLGFGASS